MMNSFSLRSIDNYVLIHKRLTYLINLPNSFRTIHNIFKGLESNTAELYNERMESYALIAAKEAESLRSVTNQLENIDHPYSKTHKDLLKAQNVQFVERPLNTSSTNANLLTNYTLYVSTMQYLTKATELKRYNLEELKKGESEVKDDTKESFNRLANFMIENGQATLLYYTDKSKDHYHEEIEKKERSKSKFIMILMIVNPIVAVIFLLAFIPFILKVQANLLKIYLYLCKFKDEDVRNWLKICNDASSDLTASINQIVKSFKTTDFDINVSKKVSTIMEIQKKVNKDEEMKDGHVTETQNQTEAPFVKQSETEDSEEKVLINSISDLSARRQKIFSAMSKKETKKYLLYLAFLLLYLAAVRALDIFLFLKYSKEVDDNLHILRILSERVHNNRLGEFFLREELMIEKVIEYFGSNLNIKL